MSTYIRNALEFYRQKGALPLLRRAFQRLILQHVSRVVYEFDLSDNLPDPRWADDESILVYGPEDQAAIPSELIQLLGREAKISIGALAKGNHLVAVRLSGRFVHYGFIFTDTRQVRILGEPKSTPYIGNCFTSAEARGRGIYKRALQLEMHMLQKQGHKRVVIETDTDNISSQHGIQGAGFHLVRRMEGLVLFNKIAVQYVTPVGSERRLRIWIV